MTPTTQQQLKRISSGGSMTYHQMMQNHLDTRPPMVILKDLTPMQMLDNSRRPLPIFVNGVRTDGPVGSVERLAIARGKKS